MGKSPKKPITKRKWFWPVVGVFAVGAIAGGGGDKEEQKQPPVEPSKSVIQIDNSDRSALPDVSNQAEDVSSQTAEPDVSTDKSEQKEPDPELVTPQKPEPDLGSKSEQAPSQDPKLETPDPASDPEPVNNQKPEPEPTSDQESESGPKPEKTIKGKSSDTIVYVSTRSNTIHSVNDCGGMKNYREMTLGEADERNYKYCPNCW